MSIEAMKAIFISYFNSWPFSSYCSSDVIIDPNELNKMAYDKSTMEKLSSFAGPSITAEARESSGYSGEFGPLPPSAKPAQAPSASTSLNSSSTAAAGPSQSTACFVCGKAEARRCSRCKKETFCSQACLKLAWPEHKKTCKPVG